MKNIPAGASDDDDLQSFTLSSLNRMDAKVRSESLFETMVVILLHD